MDVILACHFPWENVLFHPVLCIVYVFLKSFFLKFLQLTFENISLYVHYLLSSLTFFPVLLLM